MDKLNVKVKKANGNNKGGVTNGKGIANTRVLLAFIYNF